MITCMVDNPIALMNGERLIHVAAAPLRDNTQRCTRCCRQFVGAYYQTGQLVVEIQTDKSTAFVAMIYLM